MVSDEVRFELDDAKRRALSIRNSRGRSDASTRASINGDRSPPTSASLLSTTLSSHFLRVFTCVIPLVEHLTMASRPEIKEEDESGFCKFFRNLPEKNDETVRIFDRGDYYSAHGEDAMFIANTVCT
jgi:hypothetical protein